MEASDWFLTVLVVLGMLSMLDMLVVALLLELVATLEIGFKNAVAAPQPRQPRRETFHMLGTICLSLYPISLYLSDFLFC